MTLGRQEDRGWLRYQLAGLAGAVLLGGTGGFWLVSKILLLFTVRGTHVGLDTIILGYSTFVFASLLATVVAVSVTDSRWIRKTAQCIVAMNLSLLVLFFVLHLSGKLVSKGEMIQDERSASGDTASMERGRERPPREGFVESSAPTRGAVEATGEDSAAGQAIRDRLPEAPKSDETPLQVGGEVLEPHRISGRNDDAYRAQREIGPWHFSPGSGAA